MKGRNYYSGRAKCHICFLPIPSGIAESRHPLFGTIDHITPRSKGGTDKASNLAPAHHYCNSVRGNADITEQLRWEFFAHIIRMSDANSSEIRSARKRLEKPAHVRAARKRMVRKWTYILLCAFAPPKNWGAEGW